MKRKFDDSARKVWTVEEAANILLVSVLTVRRWIRTSKIKANRVGRVWRIPDSEIKKYSEVQDH